jgi:hypothetical protein
MNMQETSEIRELTAEEMECVTGGLTPVFLFPVLTSIFWTFADCVQDETGNGTTVGNCDTF